MRTVQQSGEAWIIVPPPPRNELERAMLSTVMLEKAYKLLERRLTLSKNIVRCSACLPSTSGWYHSLAIVTQRVLGNVPQVQDPNSSEYEIQRSIVGQLQCAETQLQDAADSVIQRSSSISSGLCGWCGSRWGQADMAKKTSQVESARYEVGV